MTQTPVKNTKQFEQQTSEEDAEKLLPLENGDRLSRAEFHDRYLAMPHVKKAQLIEGVVYMPSPVRHRSHGKPHAAIAGWLLNYQVATPGVDLGIETTVFLDGDNEPQPDALLRIENGGNSRITDDDYVQGAPELIVEIAASTASYDLHDKKKAYRRNG
ncbi:MAG: Uma2 family endonuclease, partial [Microcoleus sp.]